MVRGWQKAFGNGQLLIHVDVPSAHFGSPGKNTIPKSDTRLTPNWQTSLQTANQFPSSSVVLICSSIFLRSVEIKHRKSNHSDHHDTDRETPPSFFDQVSRDCTIFFDDLCVFHEQEKNSLAPSSPSCFVANMLAF